MTFEEIQNAILARLVASPIPSVFETAVPAGYLLPKDHGQFLPYLLVTFGGKSPVANSIQGIVSSTHSLKRTTVACEAIGASQRDCRTVTGIVRDLLEGYIADPSWGELTETLSGDYAVKVPEYDTWPVRFGTGIVFNCYANGVTPN
jgi:hypothetical protein